MTLDVSASLERPSSRFALAAPRLSKYGAASAAPSPVSRMMRDFSRGFRAGVDINLGVGYVNEATIPREAIVAAFAAVAAQPERYPHAFNYGESRGSGNLLAALRRFFVRHQTGGLTPQHLAERELIVGANGATSLLDAFAQVMAPGVVVTTEPQYYIYADYLRRLGFSVVAVPEDDDGIDVDAFERTVDQYADHLSFVYVVTVGNPSATILSNARRRALVAAVSRVSQRLGRKVPLLLDQAYEWLVHDPATGLQSGALSDDAGLVYEVGTLAKVLAPALRIGFLLGPPGDLLTALVQRTNDVGFSAPLINQEAAAYLLDEVVDAHLTTVRAGYRHKAQLVAAALEQQLGPWIEHSTGGKAGFYYYLTLRGIETGEGSPFYQYCSRTTGIRSLDVESEASSELAPRVIYLPGELCVDAQGTGAQRATRQLRLSFGFSEDAELERGVQLLGEAARYAAEVDRAEPAALHSAARHAFLSLLLSSYEQATGRQLVAAGTLAERVSALYRAPFVVLSHTAQAEPVYNFGNALALRLWEMTWSEFTALPSNKCAEPMHQLQRDQFLQEVSSKGFAEGYSGVRISKSGRRFRIEDVCCWNVYDASGKRVGQAARYPRWTYL